MTALHTFNEITEWVKSRNELAKVHINKVPFEKIKTWFYDEDAGEIRNANRSFFTISGIRETVTENNVEIIKEQPIILQNEIGYLGFILQKINGEVHYLIQAKIEPGNVNCVQLSPTIQATKSNFTQKHGGAKPAYLDYFTARNKYEIIYDQIQSEQNSRFYGKRNRNVILRLQDDEKIEVLPSHFWVTHSQIKELMQIDNLVNMDTRTVLSGLPSPEPSCSNNFRDEITSIYTFLNDYKMLTAPERELVPLKDLTSWHFESGELVSKDSKTANFKVIFCEIEISEREVKKWEQPLFEATGIAVFGLLTRQSPNGTELLVKAMPEIGTFDSIEIGPSVQLESNEVAKFDSVQKYFNEKLNQSKPEIDVVLSEEGGRFYHEQNRNVIIEVANAELVEPPAGYFWLPLSAAKNLMLLNNCLNIQLRNLISLLKENNV